MKDRFINFLKENNAYDGFCEQVERFGRFKSADGWFDQILKLEGNPYALISGAFIWDGKANECADWRELDKGWTQILRDNERED